MKIYIITDMEGVAGILNFDDWCVPTGRYYELGKELLTREVNAAVEGFFDGGATAIRVSDGHGRGGINPLLLDARVELKRGSSDGWAFPDEGFHALAFIGQHAKAGTPFAHIAHTQYWDHFDFIVNDVSIGEFGQGAFTAAERGIRTIFAAGDLALTREAAALAPGLVTVAGKRGLNPGTGNELSLEEYARCNLGAIHCHPERVRQLLRQGAAAAVRRARDDADYGRIAWRPPFAATMILRAGHGRGRRVVRATHPDSVSALFDRLYARAQPASRPARGQRPLRAGRRR